MTLRTNTALLLFIFFLLPARAADCNRLLQGLGPSEGVYTPLEQASIDEAKRRTDAILSLKGNGLVEHKITSHQDRQDIIFVYGVPNAVKKIEHDGKTVFRHYSLEHLDAILASQTLKAGPRPFIDPEAHARWEYQDLSGIMFTKPDFDPRYLWMGIKHDHDWVEFTLDASIPVLYCKEGNYLIPTQRNYPEWIRSAYRTYKNTGSAPSGSMRSMFAEIDAEGGLQPQAEIPIRIVRYQKDGVITDVQSDATGIKKESGTL